MGGWYNKTMKTNYSKQTEQIFEEIKDKQPKPKLLLQSCCGPCSSYVLTYLTQHFDIYLYYYNPNVYPAQEYAKRLETQKQNNLELRKRIKQLEREIAKQDEKILDKNEKLNNIQIGYNPKWKESKALPTKDDMVEFEDI